MFTQCIVIVIIMSATFAEVSYLDTAFLSSVLGRPVASVVPSSMAGSGGLNAIMARLTVTFADGGVATFVQKELLAGRPELGLAREALFYEKMARDLLKSTPAVYHAYGDMATGRKQLLFEDLSSAVQCGYFFGYGSPHNNGKDLALITSSFPDVDCRFITLEAFRTLARIHGRHWMSASLLGRSWLRCSSYFRAAPSGDEEAHFYSVHKVATDAWSKVLSSLNTSSVVWDDAVLSLMSASFSKISWRDYQTSLLTHPWTLMHGDFHPANLMMREDTREVVILDWEVVGIGRGAQDLGQFVISHMSAADRRSVEDEALRAYYSALCLSAGGALDAAAYTLGACREEYVAGGVARWVWLLAYIASCCPETMTQYFHDQLLAFAVDNGVTPDSVEMPRI